jgi:hypothetical protein
VTFGRISSQNPLTTGTSSSLSLIVSSRASLLSLVSPLGSGALTRLLALITAEGRGSPGCVAFLGDCDLLMVHFNDKKLVGLSMG